MKTNRFPSLADSVYEKGLPDPLRKPDGSRIESPLEWQEQRLYLRDMLAHYLHGHMPERFDPVSVTDTKEALSEDGSMMISYSTLHAGIDGKISFSIRMVYPKTAKKGGFSVIVRNHGSMPEGILLEEKMAVAAGYCLITFDRNEVAIDGPGRKDLIFQMYPEADWGVTTVWAWAHMRIVDALSFFPFLNSENICFTGHSRGGKAAACAGIWDERAKVVVPNGSGCGGLGCLRFLGSYGGLRQNPKECETIGSMTQSFPDWCCKTINEFGNMEAPYAVEKEFYLPFDLHFLRAAIAPRAVLGTEGENDDWVNPVGSYITWSAAREVFDFLGCPSHNRIHFRPGEHEHGEADWKALLSFCEEIFSE